MCGKRYREDTYPGLSETFALRSLGAGHIKLASIEPLPLYGRDREQHGGRYISSIHGSGLQDVVITGSCFVATQILILNCYMITVET